jgi:glycosyltransferase involved in cell wall biosynthesis
MSEKSISSEQGKKRLLVLASTFPRWAGDTEPRFVLDLSNRLADIFDVSVLAPFSPDSAKRERLERVQVRRFKYCPIDKWSTLAAPGSIMGNIKQRPYIGLLLPLFFLCQILALLRELRRSEYDVIHVHWIIPQAISLWIARWFTKAPPFVVTAHGGDAALSRLPVLDQLAQICLRGSEASTVVAEHLRSHALQSAIVAPMGVDVDRFSEVSGEGDPRLVFIGRLARKKGVDILLEALPSLPEDLELYVIGDGEERKALENMGTRARFAGALNHDEIIKFLRRTDIICLPFRDAGPLDSDGTPIVLLEMAAAGLAMVASDIEAIDQVFSDDAVTKFKADDVIDLIEKLRFVISNSDRVKSQVSTAQKEVNKFYWSNVAETYAYLLLKISNYR